MNSYETIPNKKLDIGLCPQCASEKTDIINHHLYCEKCGSYWSVEVYVDNGSVKHKRVSAEIVDSYDDNIYWKAMLGR